MKQLIYNKQRVSCCLLFVICFLLFISCKTKQTNTAKTTEVPEPTNAIKAVGVVSHKYRVSGCQTIIVCKRETEKDTLFLIPMTSLGEFDKDSLQISFIYQILRVHNPKGCHGMPILVSDINAK